MNWEQLLKNLVQSAGIAGMKKAEEALEDIKNQVDAPWKAAIMDMLADAVEEFGWEGIELVQNAIDKLVDGKVPDLSFASLKSRSDALSFMQNAEADEKSQVQDFFSVIGKALGVILKAVIVGLIK